MARSCSDEMKAYPIKVTFSVELPGLTVADTRTTFVDCKHECTIEIASDGNAFSVRLMPDDVCQPKFLLVRPVKIDGKEIKKPEDLAPLRLWYATVPDGANPERDRKPIEGTHVFANGMAEWVTDMTKAGGPGPLTKLFFWNNTKVPDPAMDSAGKPVIKDGKVVIKKDENGNDVMKPAPVEVLIFIGYSPVPPDGTKPHGAN